MNSPAPRPPALVTQPPRVVMFVSGPNRSLSPMAEGFAHAMAPKDARIFCCGAVAADPHPMAVEVMAEVEIDVAGMRSRLVSEIPVDELDTVIHLYAEGPEIPVGPHVRRLTWPLTDPADAPEGERKAAFREMRDEIRWRISCLWPAGD